jgi:protein-L-isoaspartate(D-aspartate) O-methyltransferase
VTVARTADALVDLLCAHVSDPRVLEAIRTVPRDAFVPAELRSQAWENRPLPIPEGQTISQPLIVARMCALLELRGEELVLDVGTGSGYHAALLARLGGRVVSVERHEALARSAAARLARLGIGNVEVRTGDGALGAPDVAPFDAVNVAAAAAGDTVPAALEDQLAPGGRLVAPVGGEDQRLVLVRRSADGRRLARRALEGVRFVPLVR